MCKLIAVKTNETIKMACSSSCNMQAIIIEKINNFEIYDYFAEIFKII